MGGYAKLSEKSIREAKVEQVKQKILRDISNRMRIRKRELRLCADSGNDNHFAKLVKDVSALLSLREYLEDERTFMSWVIGLLWVK